MVTRKGLALASRTEGITSASSSTKSGQRLITSCWTMTASMRSLAATASRMGFTVGSRNTGGPVSSGFRTLLPVAGSSARIASWVCSENSGIERPAGSSSSQASTVMAPPPLTTETRLPRKSGRCRKPTIRSIISSIPTHGDGSRLTQEPLPDPLAAAQRGGVARHRAAAERGEPTLPDEDRLAERGPSRDFEEAPAVADALYVGAHHPGLLVGFEVGEIVGLVEVAGVAVAHHLAEADSEAHGLADQRGGEAAALGEDAHRAGFAGEVRARTQRERAFRAVDAEAIGAHDSACRSRARSGRSAPPSARPRRSRFPGSRRSGSGRRARASPRSRRRPARHGERRRRRSPCRPAPGCPALAHRLRSPSTSVAPGFTA